MPGEHPHHRIILEITCVYPENISRDLSFSFTKYIYIYTYIYTPQLFYGFFFSLNKTLVFCPFPVWILLCCMYSCFSVHTEMESLQLSTDPAPKIKKVCDVQARQEALSSCKTGMDAL